MRKLFLIFLFVLLFSIVASAQLPPAIARIIEANQRDAHNALENISFLIAFLAGVLSIFSPCTMALLPAFFSYSFKEKTEITKMTLVFFAGFSISFVSVGLLVVFLGKTSFAFFQQSTTGVLVQIVGAILILFGMMSVFGKGFSGLVLHMNTKKDVPGIFLFGVLFAFGWTACIGPIIASILLMGSVLHNYVYTAFLLFFYTLGIALPLFAMAFFYDRFNLAENKIIQGKIINMRVFRFSWEVHTTHLISGLMFIFLGLLFMLYKGTSIINIVDLFGMLATLVLLLLLVFLIDRFILSKISSKNARKISLFGLVIAAIFAFNYLRVTFGLRTLGWAEVADRLILESTKTYNAVAFLILLVFAALIYAAIKPAKKK